METCQGNGKCQANGNMSGKLKYVKMSFEATTGNELTYIETQNL